LPRPPVTPPREAVTRGAEFVAARRDEIDELAHAAAVSRHRQPLRRSHRDPSARRTSGPAASRGGAPIRATRRHPATAALLIAVLVIVVVVAVAIVSAAHG
jgi:ferric-dicitrate binding protein FerR (iron transport regulator)